MLEFFGFMSRRRFLICKMIWKKFCVKKVILWREICRRSWSLVVVVRGRKSRCRADKDERSMVRVRRVSAAGEEKDIF